MNKASSREAQVLKSSFGRVWQADARLLILGSLPSDESLRMNRYYAHPRNAFWPIMEHLLGIDAKLPYDDKLSQLVAHRIALWDVVASASRPGSLDSSIRNVTVNDIADLVAQSPNLERIGCNGGTAMRLLKRYFPDLVQRIPVIRLPSTSPAAAMWTREQKEAEFRKFLQPILG
jgi:hypoxanthine-DNA glycosylase